MSDVAVIDAGVVLKTLLPDPLRPACRKLLDTLAEQGSELVAPVLWAYETTSVLAKAVHFDQLEPAEARQALRQVEALGVRLVPPNTAQSRAAFDWTLKLHRAAAYDCYYLALAETLGCTLWTTDHRLARSVDLPWVRQVE